MGDNQENQLEKKLELAKRRSTYAVGTFCDTWALSFRQFFPLFIGWILSLALPVAVLVVTVCSGLFLDYKAGFDRGAWWTIAGLLTPGLVIGWLWAGWNLIALKVARGIPVRASDMFRPLPQMLSAAAVLAISSVLIGLGSFLVIPGALLFLKWQLAAFYIVDRGYGPIRALRQSWHDTDFVFIPLALLDLMLVGIATLSSATIFGPFMCHIAFTVASAIVYSKWLTDEDNPEVPKLEEA